MGGVSDLNVRIRYREVVQGGVSGDTIITAEIMSDEVPVTKHEKLNFRSICWSDECGVRIYSMYVVDYKGIQKTIGAHRFEIDPDDHRKCRVFMQYHETLKEVK